MVSGVILTRQESRLFNCKYDDGGNFDKGAAQVSLNNQWFYIDQNGREYREPPKPLAAGWFVL
jgi:hypothetical protein